eukprot:TRINITY_DN1668_c0_g2_i1.p1 TRINITY_DN1668_c0_g2~~TRINITY_DN1668_c0_g2_i1.p1  ORF type:complete len:395 (+),score=104.70 TRINITY_DN1668_c0_g2_i1:132-1316(+)
MSASDRFDRSYQHEFKQNEDINDSNAGHQPITKTYENREQQWKFNNQKAQKNGPHRTIYWVKQQRKPEDSSIKGKGQKWETSMKYIGDWKSNEKCGFGIQYYPNGDKYEGGWDKNMRNGQGTLWVAGAKGKLRREYTGDWEADKKSGRGTMFFANGDRYDGFWLDNKPHDEGRMIYENGDVYEGQWHFGKRSGYGVLTKRNGDHFEGHWVNDLREGQGSYFFAEKNKIFVGEWVNDMPKTGVYSEVEDSSAPKKRSKEAYEDAYTLPEIPPIGLAAPTGVLQKALEEVKKDRTLYRARFVPLYELYNDDELEELLKEFKTASNSKNAVNFTNLVALLHQMGIEYEEEEVRKVLKQVEDDAKEEEIPFQTFARMIAIILEDVNKDQTPAVAEGEA